MSPADPHQSQVPKVDSRPRFTDKAFDLSEGGEFWIPGLTHLSLIAEGGQAQVFRALDEQCRWVAVKVLRATSRHDRSLHRRLRKEAELLRRFDHPCLLRLYRDGVLADGRPYLVSPWVEGTSLRDLPRSLPAGKVADFFADAIDAVGHAHQAGVLHRDLHPRNVFMTEHFRACVMDFGVAKIVGAHAAESETRDGQVLGVQRYAAPEVASNGSKHATAASDVYSLGQILREYADRYQAVGQAGELERLLRFCCAPSGGGRYRDAAELATAFRAWRNRTPVPQPVKRGVSRRSLIAATPLLLATMVFFLNPAAPGRLHSATLLMNNASLVDWVLPVSAESDEARFADRQAMLDLCESVEALREPYETGQELAPTALRRFDCDRASDQLASLTGFPESARMLIDLSRLRIGLARLDAVLEVSQVEGEQDRFRLGPLSNQELNVLRDQRNQALQSLLTSGAGTRMAIEAEFYCLMQEARLPQSERASFSVGPLIGWTRAESSRFSDLLDELEAGGASRDWIVLGSARRSLSRMQAAVGSRLGNYRGDMDDQIKQIRAWLDEFPNQQALEVRHMRSEIAALTEN